MRYPRYEKITTSSSLYVVDIQKINAVIFFHSQRTMQVSDILKTLSCGTVLLP